MTIRLAVDLGLTLGNLLLLVAVILFLVVWVRRASQGT
jgi:hypothetical protein